MPSLSTVRFCGLSVAGVQSSLGWNGSQSRLVVEMVRDPGDAPAVPEVGTPVFASLGSYTFGGLLQRFDTSVDSRGGRTYAAYCVDPREILRNACVVLGDYNGGLAVPNVLNPYGSLEQSGGFGASGSTDAGMDWRVARAEIARLVNLPAAGSFGGPLRYKGYSYGLDLTEVYNPPAGYRVGPGAVNLLDLIEQVVRDSGRDYFVDLVGSSVRVRTADRSAQPALGLVQAIVTSYENAGTLVRGSYGTEDAQGEVASAVLLGAEQATLHQTDGLRNFWGYRPDGTAILGETGYSLWAARWKPGVGDDFKRGNSLPNPVLALTAPAPKFLVGPQRNPQLIGAANFMQWVAVSSGHEVMALNALPVADVVGAVQYACSTLEMRFALAGVDNWEQYLYACRPDVYARLHGAEEALPRFGGVLQALDLVPAGVKKAVNDALAAAEDGAAQLRDRLFGFVQGYANDFYGVQWLSPIPFVSSRLNPDTLDLEYAAEPTSLGWAEEGSAPLGLDAVNEDLFTDARGRFGPFVAWNAVGADLAEAGGTEGSVFEGNTYYARCQLSDGVVSAGGAPWALLRTDPFQDVRADALGGVEDVAAVNLVLDVDTLLACFGFDEMPLEIAPARRTPTGAAVPLRSNVVTYGPWTATAGTGAAVVRKDESFAPWEFGSTALMNAAAAATVSSGVSAVRSADSGTAEVVGLPAVSLGDVLQGGPLITDVSVQYSPRGATTTYRWGTYTARPGVAAKQFVDRVRQNGLLGQQVRRAMRGAARDALKNREMVRRMGAANRFNRGLVKGLRKETPHGMVVARGVEDTDGRVLNEVSLMTAPEAIVALRPDSSGLFRARAAVTLDGLFRPVTTYPSGGAPLSAYAAPSGSVSGGLTSSALNPYASGNDIAGMAYGRGYSDVKSMRTGGDPGDSRPVALRGPLVVSGWGYDTRLRETNPPPSGLVRPDLWKTGPLDPLWDEDRGVWSVHDGAVGVLRSALPAGGSGTLEVMNAASGSVASVTVHDWWGAGAASGTRTVALYEPRGHRWYALPASAGGGYYQTVQENGSGLAQRAAVNFKADQNGASAPYGIEDDPGGDRTTYVLKAAGANRAGYVSTLDQTMGSGHKTFQADVTAGRTLRANGDQQVLSPAFGVRHSSGVSAGTDMLAVFPGQHGGTQVDNMPFVALGNYSTSLNNPQRSRTPAWPNTRYNTVPESGVALVVQGPVAASNLLFLASPNTTNPASSPYATLEQDGNASAAPSQLRVRSHNGELVLNGTNLGSSGVYLHLTNRFATSKFACNGSFGADGSFGFGGTSTGGIVTDTGLAVATPGADGVYTLQLTVAGGVPSLAWV